MDISIKREYISALRLRYKLTTFRKEKIAIINEVVANLGAGIATLTFI